MIFKDEAEFARHMKIGIPLPIYMIYGDEDWQKRRWLGKLTQMVTGGEEYAVQRYTGAVGADELADAAYEISFGGGRRCVVADDLPVHLLTEGERRKLDQLVKELPQQQGAGVLVFFYSSLNAAPKRSGKEAKAAAKYASFIKEVDKAGGGVVCFDAMTHAELAELMTRVAEKHGCAIDRKLCEYMLLRCGDDAQNILNEMKKLCDYKGGGEITRADVDAVTIATPSASIFDISDKVASRDYSGACSVVGELLDEGEEPTAILYRISETYINMARAKAARAAGKTAADMAGDFPKQFAGRAFLADRAMRAQQAFSREALQKSIGILLDGEMRMKSSRADNEVILQEVLVRLFAVGRRP